MFTRVIKHLWKQIKNTIKITHTEDKDWRSTWQGALWLVTISMIPGACVRAQKWDKELKKHE
jgi:hypothetical protein